jgi:hypothetical protein
MGQGCVLWINLTGTFSRFLEICPLHKSIIRYLILIYKNETKDVEKLQYYRHSLNKFIGQLYKYSIFDFQFQERCFFLYDRDCLSHRMRHHCVDESPTFYWRRMVIFFSTFFLNKHYLHNGQNAIRTVMDYSRWFKTYTYISTAKFNAFFQFSITVEIFRNVLIHSPRLVAKRNIVGSPSSDVAVVHVFHDPRRVNKNITRNSNVLAQHGQWRWIQRGKYNAVLMTLKNS